MKENVDEVYREEARELLAGLEVSLLELEEKPGDEEVIGRIFRQIHTVKGSGAMFGFDEVASFAHEVEAVFDLVRGGRLEAGQDLISLTLEARDHIRHLVELRRDDHAAGRERGQELVARFRELAGGRGAPAREPEPQSTAAPAGMAVWRIGFRPGIDVFRAGTRLIPLFRELRALGPCDILADTGAVPELESLDAESCLLAWHIVLTTSAGEQAIRDVFLFVADDSVLTIQSLGPPPAEAPRIGEILVDSGKAEPAHVAAAAMEQRHMRTARPGARENSATIRVNAERIDSLVNVVGELVTTQARLMQFASGAGDPELQFLAEEIERLTNVLRAEAMSIRMMPIATMFGRFQRLVRDLSRELGKDVTLVTEGGETELDKNILEQLNDPLVHMIRNALDHGIETPETRRARGKNPVGHVTLRALHEGAHVVVQVSDDGAGLDHKAILSKAVEKGLVARDATLPEEAVYSLILKPGFSTASTVTEVSGRGVGMDVVARNISALRGSVGIASRPGLGSTFTLKLPLTLAIIDGLLVSVGAEHFVLPLANVQECIEIAGTDLDGDRRAKLVEVRGELIPYIVLTDFFSIPGHQPAIAHVIVVQTSIGRVGIAVDRVVGDHQTVIKNLGGLHRGNDVVSGATILADGSLALILDVERLLERVVGESRREEGVPA